MLMSAVYQLVTVLIVAVSVIPWILLAFPFLFYGSYKLLIYFTPAVKQTNRIESVAKSPILSFLGETF